MIGGTLSGLAVFALAGLSGMLVGHLLDRYYQQTSELGFEGFYEHYLASQAGFADDAPRYRAIRARAGVQQASAMEE